MPKNGSIKQVSLAARNRERRIEATKTRVGQSLIMSPSNVALPYTSRKNLELPEEEDENEMFNFIRQTIPSMRHRKSLVVPSSQKRKKAVQSVQPRYQSTPRDLF